MNAKLYESQNVVNEPANDPPDLSRRDGEFSRRATILYAALIALDGRMHAYILLCDAQEAGASDDDLIRMEVDGAAVNDIFAAVSGIASAVMAVGLCPNTPHLADRAMAMAISADRYLARMVQRWPGTSVVGPIAPDLLPTEADVRELADARQLRASLEPSMRRIVAAEPAPPPSYDSDRREHREWFVDISPSVDAVEDEQDRILLVMYSVASCVGWAKGAVMTSLVHNVLPTMWAKVEPDDDGRALIDRALRALGHDPDDFRAATRVAAKRAANVDKYRRWATTKPADFRAAMRRAFAAGGGVNRKGAEALNITAAAFRELVNLDPALASEFAAANVAAPRARPKTG